MYLVSHHCGTAVITLFICASDMSCEYTSADGSLSASDSACLCGMISADVEIGIEPSDTPMPPVLNVSGTNYFVSIDDDDPCVESSEVVSNKLSNLDTVMIVTVCPALMPVCATGDFSSLNHPPTEGGLSVAENVSKVVPDRKLCYNEVYGCLFESGM